MPPPLAEFDDSSSSGTWWEKSGLSSADVLLRLLRDMRIDQGRFGILSDDADHLCMVGLGCHEDTTAFLVCSGDKWNRIAMPQAHRLLELVVFVVVVVVFIVLIAAFGRSDFVRGDRMGDLLSLASRDAFSAVNG